VLTSLVKIRISQLVVGEELLKTVIKSLLAALVLLYSEEMLSS